MRSPALRIAHLRAPRIRLLGFRRYPASQQVFAAMVAISTDTVVLFHRLVCWAMGDSHATRTKVVAP